MDDDTKKIDSSLYNSENSDQSLPAGDPDQLASVSSENNSTDQNTQISPIIENPPEYEDIPTKPIILNLTKPTLEPLIEPIKDQKPATSQLNTSGGWIPEVEFSDATPALEQTVSEVEHTPLEISYSDEVLENPLITVKTNEIDWLPEKTMADDLDQDHTRPLPEFDAIEETSKILPENQIEEELPPWLQAIIFEEENQPQALIQEPFTDIISEKNTQAQDEPIASTVDLPVPEETPAEGIIRPDTEYESEKTKPIKVLMGQPKVTVDPNLNFEQIRNSINQMENADQKITDLANWVNHHPESKDGWELLGDLYMKNNQPRKALEAYNQASQ